MWTSIRTFVSTLVIVLLTALPALAADQEERVPPAAPDASTADLVLNSSQFQANLRSEQGLGTLVTAHSTIGQQATAFGFSPKSREATFFIIGALYAEAVGLLHSGNYDMAGLRLATIEAQLLALQAPGSLYNYTSKTRNLIEGQRYAPEALAEFLSLLQPLLDDYAKGQGADKQTLFRAGSWLVDVGLAAAAQDTGALRQAAVAQYFSQELKRLHAPKGVQEALDKLSHIIAKTDLTNHDADEVLKLVKEIQTILA
jgi:hypothetical protein